MKIKKIFTLFISFFLLATCFAGCSISRDDKWSLGKPLDKNNIKIGIIYLDEAESGWSLAHKLGIQEVVKEFNLREDQIISKYNVSEADVSNIEYAISEAVSQGVNIIIAPSWGFMDTCEKMADKYPNVVFAHASGYKSNDTNFTNYFGRLYQARYLTGIAAGLNTLTNKIGFVAAQDSTNSEVTGWLNAFAMGVESVNPDAQIIVNVTNSWFDPAGERKAAEKLIAKGCDVIAQHCDTAEPQLAAGRAGVLGIGNNLDMASFAPDTVLTSAVWNWGSYYTHLIGSIIDGSFKTDPYLGGLSDGIVDIAPLNSAIVSVTTGDAVLKAKEQIIKGELIIFSGKMETNDGQIVGTEGKAMSDDEIASDINWYYRNINVLK